MIVRVKLNSLLQKFSIQQNTVGLDFMAEKIADLCARVRAQLFPKQFQAVFPEPLKFRIAADKGHFPRNGLPDQHAVEGVEVGIFSKIAVCRRFLRGQRYRDHSERFSNFDQRARMSADGLKLADADLNRDLPETNGADTYLVIRIFENVSRQGWQPC